MPGTQIEHSVNGFRRSAILKIGLAAHCCK
jgi:hypothetical protein